MEWKFWFEFLIQFSKQLIKQIELIKLNFKFQGCLDHEFICNNTCIDKLLVVCDTKVDCIDKSDELNCGKLKFN